MLVRKLSKKKIIIITSAILAIALILFISLGSKEEKYTEEFTKVQDITTYYTFSGNIESNESQNVMSKTNLSVKKFYVHEGDIVSEGDLLFELDNTSIASNLEQAAASVELSKINYEMAKGSTKNQQLAQARLNLNTAKLNYEAASGSSKDQQVTQITNALNSAQSSHDSAKLNLERVTALYQRGGAALIEVEQAQAAYDAAKMQLDVAQINFDNMESTINQNVSLANEQLIAAQSTYDSLQESLNHNIRIAEEQLKQAQASYNLLKEQAEDMRVLSEVDGEISKIHVTENQSLIMGTPIMDIVNFDDLIVKLRVDEYDLKAITLDKVAEVTVSSLKETVAGKVTDISKQALVVNGVSFFEATISLEDNENLRVGLSTEVKIVNESVKNAVTISMKALQFDNENKPYVYYRDEKGKVAAKYVTVGINDGIIVQILEGLNASEAILIPAEELWNPMMGPPRRED